MRLIPWTLAAAALAALGACQPTDPYGNPRPLTDTERALGGAAAGALAADILDEDPLAGAAVGAAAGALADDAGVLR